LSPLLARVGRVQSSSTSSPVHPPTFKQFEEFFFDFSRIFTFYNLQYSSLLHLPTLRFYHVTSEVAGIEPKIVARSHWQLDDLTLRLELIMHKPDLDHIRRMLCSKYSIYLYVTVHIYITVQCCRSVRLCFPSGEEIQFLFRVELVKISRKNLRYYAHIIGL